MTKLILPARFGNPLTLSELGGMNSLYLAACGSPSDSTLVWGSYIETAPLEEFLKQQPSNAAALVSAAHVLLCATAAALVKHPRLNYRVVGRKVYPIPGVNLLMPVLRGRGGEVDLAYLRHAERMSLTTIAQSMWESLQASRRAAQELTARTPEGQETRRRDAWWRWWIQRTFYFVLMGLNRCRLPIAFLDERLQLSSAVVNYLVYPNSPPLCFFKPSSLPTNAAPVYVALGPTSSQVVAEGDRPVVKRVAPLFVKADHRIVDTPMIADFVSTLRNLLHEPWRLEQPSDEIHPP